MRRTLFSLVSVAVMLSLASTSHGLVIGDFEDGVGDWTASWEKNATLAVSEVGATSGGHALAVQIAGGYWAIQYNAPSVPQITPGLKLQFDVTMVQAEWTGNNWTKVADKIAFNSDGAGGWKEYFPQATDKATGAAVASDWGPWNPGVTKSFSVDVSNYDATGATWFQIVIALQQNPNTGAGCFYFDNVKLGGPAPKIVWVSAMHPSTADPNVSSDVGFVNLLRAAGFDVDYTPGATASTSYWETLDPNKLAALDAADLVIIGRDNNSSGMASDATEIGQWAAVKSPLMLLSSYIAGSNRWQWINTTSQSARESYYSIKAADPAHTLWGGVELDVNNVVTYIDPNVASGFSSFPLIADAGLGRVLATKPDTGNMMIAEWDADLPFYATSVYTPADKRMLFCAGTQEISGQKINWGVMNLNAAGQQIFLNAVRSMLGIQAAPVAITNASFEEPAAKQQNWDGGTNSKGTFVDVPGWTSDTMANDSGIEGPNAWPGTTEGVMAGYMMGTDPSVWNQTSYAIEKGDSFVLKVDSRDNWTSDAAKPTTLKLSLFALSNGQRITLASKSVALTAAWTTFSLGFNADQASVGLKIGVELKNASNADDTNNSWIGIDNVRLENLAGSR